MGRAFLRIALAAALVASASSVSADQLTPADAISIAAANGTPGPRAVPAKVLPIPTQDVSPQLQATIAAPYMPFFNAQPKTSEEWKALVSKVYDIQVQRLPELRAGLGVSVRPVQIEGVNAFEILPSSIPEANRNRVVLHIHGGGYVFNPGETGTIEGMMIASFGGFRVISVDYRMPPDAPYPAALDDCVTVWKAFAKTTPPRNIGLIGTSTGGALVLSVALRARDEKLPLPGAIAAGTPWSDLTKTGDSYFSNEWIDNLLVTWDGWLGRAAILYAAGHDLKDPFLSPAYGDMAGVPPTILTTGTRDLFLSNTVRVHRKLRRAGVVAELNVYEGMSHGIYQDNPSMPETREVYSDIARFFDQHLGKD